MIKSLYISYFQSHKNTRMDFHPGVNALIGSSDHGKSSILRALFYLIMNRPSGLEFRSWFSKKKQDVIVSAEFEDESYVERIRGPYTNVYNIGKGDEEVGLESIGRDVPEEVSSVINMDEFNIQRQFGRTFLLEDSAGQVARVINQIVGLDIIDTSLQRSNQTIRKEKSRIEYTKEQIEKLEKSISELEWIDKVEPHIRKTEEKIAKLEKLEDRYNRLDKEVSSVLLLSNKLDDINSFLEVEEEARRVLSLYNEYDQLTKQSSRLSNLVSQIENAKTKISKLDSVVLIEHELQDLQDKSDMLEVYDSETKRLEYYIVEITKEETNIQIYDEVIKDCKRQVSKLLKEHKVCPLCRQKLGERAIKHVLKCL